MLFALDFEQLEMVISSVDWPVDVFVCNIPVAASEAEVSGRSETCLPFCGAACWVLSNQFLVSPAGYQLVYLARRSFTVVYKSLAMQLTLLKYHVPSHPHNLSDQPATRPSWCRIIVLRCHDLSLRCDALHGESPLTDGFLHVTPPPLPQPPSGTRPCIRFGLSGSSSTA